MGIPAKVSSDIPAARSSGLAPKLPTAGAASPSSTSQALVRTASPSGMPTSMLQQRRAKAGADTAQPPAQDMTAMDSETWMRLANGATESKTAAAESTTPKTAPEKTAEASEKAKTGAQSPAAGPANKESAFAHVPLINVFKKYNPFLASSINAIDSRAPGNNAFMAGLGGFLKSWAYFGKGAATAFTKGKAALPLMFMSGYKTASEHSPDAPDKIKQQSAEQSTDEVMSLLKKISSVIAQR